MTALKQTISNFRDLGTLIKSNEELVERFKCDSFCRIFLSKMFNTVVRDDIGYMDEKTIIQYKLHGIDVQPTFVYPDRYLCGMVATIRQTLYVDCKEDYLDWMGTSLLPKDFDNININEILNMVGYSLHNG